MIPLNKNDNCLYNLQVLSASPFVDEKGRVDLETHITELLRDHSDSLIADLVAHPEHRENYRQIRANLRESNSLKSFQSSLGYIQRIARCLENNDVEGFAKLTDQMSHLIPDLKLSTIFTKFSGLILPRDIEEIRAISHPKIRALVIACLINRDKIPISDLRFSKSEMLQIGPHLTYLDCRNCFDESFTSQEVTSFLESCSNKIKTLKINTDKVTRLPPLEACTDLVCGSCTGLTELPALPACTDLVCEGCTELRELPALPACTNLDCRGCTELRELPALPACTNLDCLRCRSLIALPALPVCAHLNCSNCNAITELPILPVCTHLNCSFCYNLTELPELPVCAHFFCILCDITELPALPACTNLNCSNCIRLRVLPALPECTHLNCSFCYNLTELPELPVCTHLNCSNCIRLRELPALPACTNIFYDGCVVSVTDTVPPGLRAEGQRPLENRRPTSLQIRVQELNEDPLKVLLDLEDAVLTRRFMPRIQFIEQDGRIAEGLDEGGVSRVFVSRLMQSLISHANEPKQLAFKEMDSGLHMPVFDGKRDLEVQIKGFQILGALFQLCYASSFSNQSVTTGMGFDRKFFDIITSFTFAELSQMDINTKELSPDIKLKLMTLFADAPIQKNLALLRISPANMTLKQFETLREIVMSSLDEEEKGPRGLHRTTPSPEEMEELKPWLQATLRELLLTQMSSVDDWFPAACIAKQMHGLIGTLEEWHNLSLAGAAMLDSRIQGVMDKVSLLTDDPAISCIEWEMGGRHLDLAKVKETKKYVKTWINDATSKDLERLSNFIAGSPTLAPSKKIKFQLYDTASNRLPSTHTCSFTIDLTINYPGYNQFKAKLEKALEYTSNLETSGLESV